jgi:signal transduction histidine kinase
MAVLSVADSGAGIPKSELPKIFGRFYRCDSAKRSSVRGLGLGLAFVLRIAEAHGGNVQVTSEVGSGTKFQVSIPMVPVVDAVATETNPENRSCPVAAPVLQN